MKGSQQINTTEPTEFQSILQEARNEQLVEEKEKEKRMNNFIIHGLHEKDDNTDAIHTNDASTVEIFFKNIQARPTKYTRLGKPMPDKNRPLKVEMKNIAERDMVMDNLKHLKGTEEELGRLSVREDVTQNERDQVKKFVDKVRSRNVEDSSQYWVVRGTPKNGLRLVPLARQ